ncbi:hypothetical protein T440DRAFT_186805 [Plenodomus tracheiphilus IPT5]|uniref:Uncharacterized protein n=1 Tax=Plenodomus tracheiphilus IPT5 TaxID=1408161 RepID=A0A6A7B005_9PLEO|nr:hypothetical protein T440DRAFT_186805 [Plenodomus tracheiphilus IPT5]
MIHGHRPLPRPRECCAGGARRLSMLLMYTVHYPDWLVDKQHCEYVRTWQACTQIEGARLPLDARRRCLPQTLITGSSDTSIQGPRYTLHQVPRFLRSENFICVHTLVAILTQQLHADRRVHHKLWTDAGTDHVLATCNSGPRRSANLTDTVCMVHGTGDRDHPARRLGRFIPASCSEELRTYSMITTTPSHHDLQLLDRTSSWVPM